MSKTPQSTDTDHLFALKRAYVALQKVQSKLDAIERLKTEPLAIIGMGCRFPGGANNPEAFWQLLHEGVDAITEVPADRWDVDAYYDSNIETPGKMSTRWGGFLHRVDEFDSLFFRISPRETVSMDPQQRLLLEVSWQALENAGQMSDTLLASKTGVFIGICSNDYSQLLLSRDSTAIDRYMGTGSSHSVASGRLSYILGLEGPSISVDTACSSSLVAIHLASQSLRSGECRMALAGGVNLILSPEVTINFSKAGMLAADGRCKTFDVAADGYARGEGCGMVVLKRLSDAVADGDNILCLLRGSAVNQDGRSSGLTVPNGSAQQAVIQQALANSGVEPAQVNYVEAHGTGTSLGDPIEARALAAVLGQGRSQDKPLAVGSVKTNIGHLEGAAGIAGLIKVVLALQHQEIPPHLHLQALNPHIFWGKMPVKIPTQKTPWPSGESRRIAGVSSFGFSGTNAHVVLEEAPVAEASGSSKPWHLLVLSAKTPSALETASANLVKHLKQHPDLNIADVAYTLQVGRKAFSHRLALVCRDSKDAVRALEPMNPKRVSTLFQELGEQPVVFMFPGLGSHHVNMAQEIYHTEPIFRQQVEHCCELLKPDLGLDLRLVLYPSNQQTEAASQKLEYSSIAQSALFVIEYALAKLWMEWGVYPQAMIGDGIGEYVAACLAGVFSLEDALTLVASRGRLMEQLLHSSMLSVPLSAEQVQLRLNQKLSLTASNKSSLCIISSPVEAVAQLKPHLTEKGLDYRHLHFSRTSITDSILEPFIEQVQKIQLNSPQIAYISNMTGNWITPEAAKNPEYWAMHVHQPVQLTEGITELIKVPEQILLEVGPGQTLSKLARECLFDSRPLVLSSVCHPEDLQSDAAFLLNTAGKLWLSGVHLDWLKFYASAHESRRCRVPLPTYPFERQRYWIDRRVKRA